MVKWPIRGVRIVDPPNRRQDCGGDVTRVQTGDTIEIYDPPLRAVDPTTRTTVTGSYRRFLVANGELRPL